MTHSNELSKIKGIGTKYSKRILDRLNQENIPIEHLKKLSAEELKSLFGIPINAARAIASHYQSNIQETGEVKPSITRVKASTDIRDATVLTLEDEQYPQKLKKILGDKAPPQLFCWGNFDLLERPSIGFCGSRNVTDKGINVTNDISEQVAQLGWVTVSGHAKGVDIASHITALKNGTGTIIVLPEGINGFRLKTELRKLATRENILIISQFPPNATWNVGYAMQRNSTIIGLSDAMVLVESRDSGGTFNAGLTALRLKHPLFVVRFQDTSQSNAGNDYFLQRGAAQIMKSQTTNRAIIDPIVQQVRGRTSSEPPKNPNQLTLFGDE